MMRERRSPMERLLLRWALGLFLIGAPWLVSGCAEETSNDPSMSSAKTTLPADAIQQLHTADGVEVRLRVYPRAPRLGDPLHLELEVAADPGVSVSMPAFGEQLGRFPITSFVPEELRDPATGKAEFAQRYELDLPMSGRQRIPGLLVEFSHGDGARDEVLTDEVLLDVTPIAVAEVGELRPPRGALEPLSDPDDDDTSSIVWLVVVGALILAAGLALILMRRRGAADVRDPHDVADERLAALEARGVPTDAGAIDAWWVELSAIVRHFVEARFGLRAPELTTEEFLRTARESDALAPGRREMLAALLDLADRVKFAAFMPDESQSNDAVRRARTFVADARAEATTPADASGEG